MKTTGIIGNVLLLLLGVLLTVAGWFAYRLTDHDFQTALMQRITGILSDRLGTEVHIGKTEIDFFCRVSLTDVLVLDQRKDTLLHADLLLVSLSVFKLLKNEYVIDRIVLDHPHVYMLRDRKTEEWNYQFIVDAFSSGDTTASRSPSSVNLDLKALRLKETRFVMMDEPNDTKLDFTIPILSVDLNKLDLNQPKFDVKKLLFDRADLFISKLPREFAEEAPDTIPDTAIVHINTKPLQLLVNDLEFRDCRFRYDDMVEPADTSAFDGMHQDYRQLNMHMTNCSLVMDTIKAKIRNISLVEKSGLVVDRMEADVRVTPTLASASHLTVETPHSFLKDSFSMGYQNFHAFLDFNSEVIISVMLKDSRVDMKDVNHFIPGLPPLKQMLLADGSVRGTVDNLKGRDLRLATAKNTLFLGDIDLRGLPQIEETYIMLDVERLATNTSDLSVIVPEVTWPEELTRAGNMKFTGNFTGFYNDFVAYGTLTSDLGSVKSDLNLKFSGDIEQSVYSGNVAAQQFQLGRMIAQDSLLGAVTFSLAVRGRGFDFATMNTAANGTVEAIALNGYTYRNTDINGTLDQKIFNGTVVTRDENVKVDFAGMIDFNKELPEYDFRARIDSAALQTLNLSDVPYVMSASVDMNMQGKNIDDFLGYLKVSRLHFSLGEKEWSSDSIQIEIAKLQDTTGKTLKISGSPLTAELIGQFGITSLPASVVALADHYLPSLPGIPSTGTVLQDFTFDLALRNAADAIEFFLPDWGGIDGTVISGSFRSAQSYLQLHGRVPSLQHGRISFGDVSFDAFTSGDSLSVLARSELIVINDSTRIEAPTIAGLIRNDTLQLFAGGNSPDSASYINLRTTVTGDSTHVQMHILPSIVVLNHRSWSLSPDNLLSYSDERLLFENFTLRSEQRTITITNVNRRVRATNLAFEFTDIPISDLHEQLTIGGYQYGGNLSGTVQVLNIFREPRGEADIVIRNFSLNNKQIAEVKAIVTYEPEDDKITVQTTLNDPHYDAVASGWIYPQRETEQLHLDLNLRTVDPALLQSLFFTGMISHTSGTVTGDLHVAGTFDKPELTGQVMITSLTTTVDYLKVAYHCRNVPVAFRKNQIDLGKFILYDQNNDSASAQGTIGHESLDDFNLNVLISTNRFLALNTTAGDDSSFYGSAEVSGYISFQGPVENIDISATVKSLRGTSISIPIYSGSTVGERSFIRYVGPESDTVEFKRQKQTLSGMHMSFNMDITPEANVQIIFDEATGDIVKVNGSGNLRMDIDTKGEFAMYGVYTIEQGSYVFTQFNFFNKNFVIENGGTITWTGDPYDARISFSAIYSTRASLYELVQNTALLTTEDVKDLQQRTRVDLYLILTGSLFAPEISFDIKLPETSSLNTAAYLELNRIKRDENELNKQVFALLVLGHFLPPETGVGTQSLTTDVNNSLSSFLFNQISNLASSLRDDIDFTINYQAYETNIDPSNSTDLVKRNELQVALTKRFFNDRLAVDVGGNFDFSASSTPNSSSNIAGDFAVEYKITPDGRVSGKVFSKSNYDIIDATNKQNNGISLKYTRDFDNVKELLKDPEREKKRQQRKQSKDPQQELQPAEVSPESSKVK